MISANAQHGLFKQQAMFYRNDGEKMSTINVTNLQCTKRFVRCI